MSDNISHSDGNVDRLRRVLGTPDTAWLLPRMRNRLEATGSLTGKLHKTQATLGERTAAARLVGTPVRFGLTVSVSLDEINSMLLSSGIWPAGLESAVVALTGPVTMPETRIAEREGWFAARQALRSLGTDRPELAPWAESVLGSGALKRAATTVADAHVLANRLISIANALPSAGESLGVFSARIVGDAHALDTGTSLGTLAMRLAAAVGTLATDAPVTSARWRREAWASAGIVIDELSSMVLVLGLPGGTESATAISLAALARDGQPALLTLRQLNLTSIGVIPPDVFVCENPAVVAAAADQLGASCPPLVCVSGQPGAAVIRLLITLAEGGAKLHYHGDFDWGGITIARTLGQRVDCQPWRYDAAAYSQAIASLPDLPPLKGNAVETPWDPALAPAMLAGGFKVEEEQVLASLIADLAHAAQGFERVRPQPPQPSDS